MATGRPEDPILEYDLLQQLVIGDDGVSSTRFLDASTSSDASSQMEELLTTCSVDVSIAVATSSNPLATSSTSSCASFASALSGTGCWGASADGETPRADEFTEFFVDTEHFLRDVKIEFDRENDKMPTAVEPNFGTVTFDTFPELDLLPSPCPSVLSTCQSTLDGLSCMADAHELEREGSLLVYSKETNELDEQTRKHPEAFVGHRLPSMSPLRMESSLSEVSEISSMGPTDASASASPLALMAEEVVKDPETCKENDENEEEAMENAIDLLAKEAKYLEAQVDFLQSRAKASRPQRKSLKQRGQRDTKQPNLLVKSEEDNQFLTNLVAQQKIYQENFRAMLAFAPVNEVRMALMTPLESYIRLGVDLNERRKTILSLREGKLDMTYNFIERKAAGLDLNEPYQYSDTFEKFGKHYSVDFAISRFDGVSIFQVARALRKQVAGNDEALNSAMGSTTICESFDTIKCNFMHQRIVSSMNWEGNDAEKMPDMESNAVFYCRFGDNSAVLATDYIDQDDLHPYDASKRMRRDLSNGVVLSGHTDANGKKFVVMKRYLMAKYHMYPHKVSQEQQNRFLASIPKVYDTMDTLIVDHLQRNETTGYPYPGED